MIAVVIGIYVCCWGVTVTTSLVSAKWAAVSRVRALRATGDLILFNSTINFFVYLARSREFRKAALKNVCCRNISDSEFETTQATALRTRGRQTYF